MGVSGIWIGVDVLFDSSPGGGGDVEAIVGVRMCDMEENEGWGTGGRIDTGGVVW